MSKPAVRLRFDGENMEGILVGENRPLISLTLTDEAGIVSDRLTLEFDDRDRLVTVTKDSEIEVWLGYEPQPAYMGKYRVDSWEKSGPRRALRVEAKAAEMTSEIKETKTRSWHNTTVGEIVEKIAGEHGLEAVVSEDQKSRKIDHIDQQGESDMGFLTRLAKRNGATFKPANGKLIFATKASGVAPSGQEKGLVTVVPRDVASWSFSQAERGAHKSVITYYHDHGKGKRKAVTAGEGKPAHRDRKLYGSKAEAEEAGKAKLGELNRGRKEGQFDGVGNPALYADGKVKMADFDADCDGEYFIKSVTHTFNGSGYTSSATLETEKSEPETSGESAAG